MSVRTEYSIHSSSRTRRTRMTPSLRNLVQENRIHPNNLILPVFVTDQQSNTHSEISSMPAVYHYGIDRVLSVCEDALKANLGGIILFGITQSKDEVGSSGYSEDGIIVQSIQHIKKRFPELLITADVCLCEYTSHGHCGIVHQSHNGYIIDNDATVQLLAQEALVYANAGADIIAPSDMMDGRVAAIRESLDSGGHEHLPIMSYSAKYASAFYGPFRDAVASAPSFGDRRSHQMDSANSDEAMRVIARDINEGADIIMIKPAMSYLDIIRRARDEFNIPLAAYQVSGEYAMIKAAAANGWIDEERMILETLLSIKRAGATIILTYYALEAAQLFQR